MKLFHKLSLLLFSFLFFLEASSSFGSSEATPLPLIPRSREQLLLSYAPVVKKVSPAVVNIYALRVVKSKYSSPLLNDPIFRHFFGEEFFSGQSPTRIQRSLGSGVIVRPDGVIITNNHVIKGAEAIKVVLADNREFDAEVVVREERTDLAALKLKGTIHNLPFLTLREGDDLEVGDIVLAIGNPFGLGQTVTSGIISALARTQIGVSDFRSFIQTDAAINPGNSGGALVTLDGKLIGINTSIFSQAGGSIGIGFAIPSSLVSSVVASVDRGGEIVRPWLGASTQDITSEIAAAYQQERPIGVLITDIYPGSPAEQAGFKVGDLVVAMDNQEITDSEVFKFRIATRKVNHKSHFKIIRRDQGELELEAILQAPPESPYKPMALTGRHPLSGATVADLSPALNTKLGIDLKQKGVIVLDIRRDSLAYRVGVLPGDILESLNGLKIKTVEELARQIVRTRGEWRIVIDREGEIYEINLRS